eukprot:3581462-Lingulodinium_polyedra.AAC.1
MPWFAAQGPQQSLKGSLRKVRNAAEVGWKGRGQDVSGAARLLPAGRPLAAVGLQELGQHGAARVGAVVAGQQQHARAELQWQTTECQLATD